MTDFIIGVPNRARVGASDADALAGKVVTVGVGIENGGVALAQVGFGQAGDEIKSVGNVRRAGKDDGFWMMGAT